jgi:molecular chaperone GrpE (heat shock protein)
MTQLQTALLNSELKQFLQEGIQDTIKPVGRTEVIERKAYPTLRPWSRNEIENCKDDGLQKLNVFLNKSWDFFKEVKDGTNNTISEELITQLEMLYEEFEEIVLECVSEKSCYETARKNRYEHIMTYLLPIFQKFNIIESVA